jgi:hypothetical protein
MKNTSVHKNLNMALDEDQGRLGCCQEKRDAAKKSFEHAMSYSENDV